MKSFLKKNTPQISRGVLSVLKLYSFRHEFSNRFALVVSSGIKAFFPYGNFIEAIIDGDSYSRAFFFHADHFFVSFQHGFTDEKYGEFSRKNGYFSVRGYADFRTVPNFDFYVCNTLLNRGNLFCFSLGNAQNIPGFSGISDSLPEHSSRKLQYFQKFRMVGKKPEHHLPGSVRDIHLFCHNPVMIRRREFVCQCVEYEKSRFQLL